ncbi:MAG: GNAT family N-acetyltransferase [Bacteroidales bacterium]|jgi:GNAT superfamily N-acetyltransferase|nr:GNAT family N-acetyltransferase [Bacteroidales bacterium]HHV39825.1 GNAT family N-acetyltransferase [Bacteroidales bacterium]
MNIRKATLQDAETLAANQVAMALESEGMALDPGTVKQGTLAYLQDETLGTAYVAEKDGHMVGSLLVTREWSDWRNAWVWWIQSVYVVPSYRGQGVYKAMYSYLQQQVRRSKDVKGIRLYVDKENRTARNVYDRLGMSHEHYVTYEWMKDQ